MNQHPSWVVCDECKRQQHITTVVSKKEVVDDEIMHVYLCNSCAAKLAANAAAALKKLENLTFSQRMRLLNYGSRKPGNLSPKKPQAD